MFEEYAVELIKRFEGLSLTKYKCPAGYPTIGYGHVIKDGEEWLNAGISKEQAEDLLEDDLVSYIMGVKKLVKVKISDHAFGALISFAYNLGLDSLRISTLLKKINLKQMEAAGDEIMKWIKIKKDGKFVTLPGLVNRRRAERICLLTKDIA